MPSSPAATPAKGKTRLSDTGFSLAPCPKISCDKLLSFPLEQVKATETKAGTGIRLVSNGCQNTTQTER